MTDAAAQPGAELFRTYLDESEDVARGVYVVGGFVGEANAWEELQSDWLNCLPSGLVFHATDCFTGNKDFKDMDIPKRVQLLDRLTDSILQHDVKLIGYGIDAITFREYAPRTLANDFLGNKYAAPFGGAVELACHAMGNLPTPSSWQLDEQEHWEQCAFFIESNQYSPSAERTIASMRHSRELWYRNRIGKAVYGEKRGSACIPLLQVADLGAFLAAKTITGSPEGRISWKVYFDKLKSGGRFHRTMIADKYSLEKLNEAFMQERQDFDQSTTAPAEST